MPDDSWCSTFPAVTLNPGSVDYPYMCFEWDGVMIDAPFNPITIATPVCTDTAQLIDYQLITGGNINKNDFKITIRTELNIIRLTPLVTGVGLTTPETITVIGTLPDGTT